MTRDPDDEARQLALFELSLLFALIDRAVAAGAYENAGLMLERARLALERSRADLQIAPRSSGIRRVPGRSRNRAD